MAYDEYPDEKGLRYPVAFLYSLVIALFWVPAFVLRRTARFVRELGAENWPQANGLVTGGNVKVVHGWVVDYAIGQLDYSYRVAGEYYAGSVNRQYPDEQAAWNFVDARRGKPVVVRHKDDKAQASVLLDADQDPCWSKGPEPSLPVMVWQHWRDELPGEEPQVQADKDLDMDVEETDPTDPVGRRD